MAALTIVTLGDSNTAAGAVYGSTANQRWPVVLTAALNSAYNPTTTYTLQNSGVAGEASTHISANLQTYCLDYNPNIVCLMPGTNDVSSWQFGAGTQEGFPASKAATEVALRDIISRCQNAGAKVVIMQAPVAAPNVGGTNFAGLNYYNASNGVYQYGRPRSALIEYAALCDSLASEYGIPVVQTWDNFAALGWSGTNNTTNADVYDGVHLDASGQARVAGWAYTAVVSLLAEDGSIRTTGIILAPDPRWTQSGSALSVSAEVNARTSVEAAVTSVGGGPLIFRGTDADKFSASLNEVEWSESVTIPAGASTVYLSVEAVDGDDTLTATVGVPL